MIFPRAGIALFLLCSAGAARAHDAQDMPSREVLAAMVQQITSKPVPTAITFHPHGGAPDSLCRLEPAQMALSRNGGTVRSLSVLVDPVSGAEGPKQFFATLSRVPVDADGAGRSYHPE